MAANRDDILGKITHILTDALGVDEDEVTLDATLQDDLGAESIDFLDIVFQLEKAFGIKIPRSELFPDDLQSNPDFIDGDRLTPLGLQKLREAMPHADFSEFDKDPQVAKLGDLFTVRLIVNYIEGKLAA